MSRTLFRLAEKITNTPHLVTGDYLDRVCEYIEKRNMGQVELVIDPVKRTYWEDELLYNEDTKVGIISIEGPLTYLHYKGICGESGPSYEMIKSQFDQMVKLGAKNIVMDQDSVGGEAYMSMETAAYMRKVADEQGINLISYVDGGSYSASYVFSAVAHEVISNPQAEVGSIGVVVRLRNNNKQKQAEGIEESYIFAGKGKVPFKEDGGFDEEFLEDLSYKVGLTYEEFVNHVASYRGISPEAIKDFGAKTFVAKDALERGLIDRVMTHEQFADYLATLVEEKDMAISLRENKMNLKELQEVNTTLQASLEEAQIGFTELQQAHDLAQEELASALAEVAALKAALDEATTEAKNLVEQKRKKALEEVTSEEEAAVLYASLSSLDDTAFDAVVASFAKKATTLEQSNLFQEQGNSQQAEDPPSDKPSLKDKIAKKYNTEGAK